MNWYKIHKLAEEIQEDLFEKSIEKSIEKKPKEDSLEKLKEERDRPVFIRGFEDKGGGFFVMIKAGGRYYAYQVSFKEDIYKVKEWMKRNPGECIKWLRKGFQEFEVTKNYPAYGSIIRDIKENKNDSV